MKNLFLNISQHPQENPVLESLFNKFKKRLQHNCFPVKFAKVLRTPFLQNNSSDCFYFSEDLPRRFSNTKLINII